MTRFETLLADDLSRAVTSHAIAEFPRLFGSSNAEGSQMAVRAAGPLESGETLATSLVVLGQDLIAKLRHL